MKAKSITGNSPEEIKTTLQLSMADGYKPTLAFVFLTRPEDIDPVIAIFDSNGVSLFGATTTQKFTDQGIEPEGIVALLLDMNPADFKIVLEDFNPGSVYESACDIGEAGRNSFAHPAFIISAADINTPGEEVIKGLMDKAGTGIIVIGGMAGEPYRFTATVFTNHSKSNCGLVSLILDEDKIDVKGIAVSGWKPVGTAKKITRSAGTWIYTIDNEPAMDVIKKFLGKELFPDKATEEIVNLAIYDNYPLQVQRVSGQPMMRPLLLWNTTDQSVMVGGPVTEGSLFRFSLPPDLEVIDTVIESSKVIKEKDLPDADAMIIFSCIGRLSSLGPMSSSEIEGLTATWNTPMAGFFSLGEFGKVDDSRPEFHGTTVSWVALKEK